MKLIGKGNKTISRITDGTSSVVLDLTNENQIIPVSETGENYAYAKTTANLYEGNRLVTSNIIYEIAEIGRIEGSWNASTRTYTVTNMLEDSANVSIKATYKNIVYEAVFSLSKIYNGVDTIIVDLTNDRHIFATDYNGNLIKEESITTEMVAYQGNEIIPLTKISLPTEPIPGLKLELVPPQTIKITALEGGDLAFTGVFNITGRIGFEGYKKEFRWIKVMNGEPGPPGEEGPQGEPGPPGKDGEEGPPGPTLDWIQDWDSNKTFINDQKIITPRIFAGAVTGDLPTGIALGKDIFGSNGPIPSLNRISGLAAYNKGKKTFHLETDGSLLAGFENGSHISFDPVAGELDIRASQITIGLSSVTTENQVDDKLDSMQGTISTNIDSAISSNSQEIIDYVNNNYATGDSVNQITQKVNTLITTTNEGLSINLTEAQSYADKVNDNLQSFVKEVTTQIQFTTEGLVLGKTDSTFNAELSNTKLAFKQDGKEVAYVSNNTLYITTAEIQESLSIGNNSEGFYTWSQSQNGNLGLRWIGR